MVKSVTANLPAIRPPADDECGPAMLALTKPQQTFVKALVEHGARSNTEAAMLAGYGGSPQAANVAAKNLMRTRAVLEAIREETDKLQRSFALRAIHNIARIADTPGDKDCYKANLELLNRAGLIVATEHKVVVEDNRGREEILKAIVHMAKKNGLDPKTLLGYDPDAPVLDANFTEVCIQTSDTPDMSAEGLEDVLG